MDRVAWLSGLPVYLQSIPIINLAIPGSHNSMSYGLNSQSRVGPDADKTTRFINALFPIFTRRWAKTQSSTIKQQLEMGIRYFDLRIALDKGKFYYCHGLLAMEWCEPLVELLNFLDKNPKEVVILDFQHFYGMTIEDHKILIESISEIFGKRVFAPADGRLLECTLQQCHRLDKQIIIIYRRCPYDICSNFYSSDEWPTPWPNVTSCTKLERYLDMALLTRKPMQGYVSQCIITPTARYIAIRCLSSLRSTAKKVKSALHAWIESQIPGAFENRTHPKINVIISDYVELNNGEFSNWVIELNYKLLNQLNSVEYN